MSSLNTIERISPEVYDYNNLNFESNHAIKNPEEFQKSAASDFSGSIAIDSLGELDNVSLAVNYFSEHKQGFTEVKKASEDLDSGTLDLPAYELRRMPIEVFVGVLVDSGVMSQSIIDRGLLDRFSPDRLVVSEGVEQYTGAFRHIFLGDIRGGLHDVDTIEDAGLAGAGRDTLRTAPTQKGDKIRNKVGSGIENNPDLRTGTAIDKDGDGETDLVRIRTMDAKSQFPEHWSTDKVIETIVSTADSAGEEMGDGKTLRHSVVINESIDGSDTEFTVVTFTNKETGLIENSYTLWGARRVDVKAAA
jgi:hypothetical protein